MSTRMMPWENCIIYSFLLLTCCWFQLNAGIQFPKHLDNIDSHEMSLSLDSGMDLNSYEGNHMDDRSRMKKELQEDIDQVDHSAEKNSDFRLKVPSDVQIVNENENANLNEQNQYEEEVPSDKSSPLQDEKELNQLNCVSGRKKEGVGYTTSFHDQSDALDMSNVLKMDSTIYGNEDTTICWNEIITIKEDTTFTPPKRLVIREYMISFESSATMQDKFFDCRGIPGELKPQDPETKKTALFEVIDENTHISKSVNFVQVNRVGDIMIWEHKIVKCAVGPLMNRTIIEWKKDDTAHPNKRLEIKVSPKMHSIAAEDCSSESSPTTEQIEQTSNSVESCNSDDSGESCSKEQSNNSQDSTTKSSCEEGSESPECTSESPTSKSCESDSSCNCENSQDCEEFTSKKENMPLKPLETDRANDDSEEVDKTTPRATIKPKEAISPLLDEGKPSKESKEPRENVESEPESTTVQESQTLIVEPSDITNLLNQTKRSGQDLLNELNSTQIPEQDTSISTGSKMMPDNHRGEKDNDSTSIDNVLPTMETRRSTLQDVKASPNHKLKLKVRLVLEHVNEHQENNSLIEVEKHLMLDEIEHGNEDLLKKIETLNKSTNVAAIKALFNGTSLEQILDSVEDNDTLTNSSAQILRRQIKDGKFVEKLSLVNKGTNSSMKPIHPGHSDKKFDEKLSLSNKDEGNNSSAKHLHPEHSDGKFDKNKGTNSSTESSHPEHSDVKNNDKLSSSKKDKGVEQKQGVDTGIKKENKKEIKLKRKTRSVTRGLTKSETLGIKKDLVTGLNHLMTKLPKEERIGNIRYTKIFKILMDEEDLGIHKRRKRSMRNIQEIGRWSNQRVSDTLFGNKLASSIQIVLYKDLN